MSETSTSCIASVRPQSAGAARSGPFIGFPAGPSAGAPDPRRSTARPALTSLTPPGPARPARARAPGRRPAHRPPGGGGAPSLHPHRARLMPKTSTRGQQYLDQTSRGLHRLLGGSMGGLAPARSCIQLNGIAFHDAAGAPLGNHRALSPQP